MLQQHKYETKCRRIIPICTLWAVALAKRVSAYDRVVIQFHPDMFFPIGSTGARRLEVTLGLLAVFRLADVEVRVHEVNYEFGRGHSVLARATRAEWAARFGDQDVCVEPVLQLEESDGG